MTSSPPTKQELISLVESMCGIQDRMLDARGMPEHIQRPHVDNMEALKAPVFFLWELLGYGTARELSEKGINSVWIDSKYQITSFLLMKSNSLCRSSSFAPFR